MSQNFISLPCMTCSGTGWVQAIQLSTQSRYAFRCGVCKASENFGLSKLIPLWTSAQKGKYERYDEWFMGKKWQTNSTKQGAVK